MHHRGSIFLDVPGQRRCRPYQQVSCMEEGHRHTQHARTTHITYSYRLFPCTQEWARWLEQEDLSMTAALTQCKGRCFGFMAGVRIRHMDDEAIAAAVGALGGLQKSFDYCIEGEFEELQTNEFNSYPPNAYGQVWNMQYDCSAIQECPLYRSVHSFIQSRGKSALFQRLVAAKHAVKRARV
jgi:hypothetical protein